LIISAPVDDVVVVLAEVSVVLVELVELIAEEATYGSAITPNILK